MNHIFKTLWNQSTGSYVAVSEISQSSGKRSSCVAMGGPLNVRWTGLSLALKSIALSMAFAFAPAQALPAGSAIASGKVDITNNSGITTLNQSTQNAVLNWQSFSILANEVVKIVQPNSSSVLLNRVVGSEPSNILGTMSANGKVFLVNPNGILFGQNAAVNVSGLVASALNISDANFLAGRYKFEASPPTSSSGIVNNGSLAADAGFIALLGASVNNQGVIAAKLGTVVMAAGNAITLDVAGDGLLSVKVDKIAVDALVRNGGLLQADGGKVLLTAQAAGDLVKSAVSNTGVIQARSFESHNGSIVLLAGMKNGTVNAAGVLDASAPHGGNGGFIETSAAHMHLDSNLKLTTSAALGHTGTWLIDPQDFTIAATGGDMTGAQLSTSLSATSITIKSQAGTTAGAGGVNVNDAVAWSANTLTLNAEGNIFINAAMTGTGSAKLALQYGQNAVAAGNMSNYVVKAPVNLEAGDNFSTLLGSDGVVKNFTVITGLGTIADVLNPPAVATLQGIASDINLGRNFALGSNIDASDTKSVRFNSDLTGFMPIGVIDAASKYRGTFDGLGHTVSNLHINRPSLVDVGLFGATDTTAAIQNIGLVGGSVTGAAGTGGLVGNSFGTVDNSFNTGSVSGAVNTGGLVGSSSVGLISNSYATGPVSGAAGTGGLVGTTFGAIINSYATGKVMGAVGTGGLAGSVGGSIVNSHSANLVSGAAGTGGLVGLIIGDVRESYHTDGITSGPHPVDAVYGTTPVGGLVGYSIDGSIISSYNTANVTGTAATGGLAGMLTNGAVSNSNNSGNISGAAATGGLVGNAITGSIANSFNIGNVTGGPQTGGLVGLLTSSGTVSNSYNIGNITGAASVGGVVGTTAGTVINSYNSGDVRGSSAIGGLVGTSSGEVTNSYASGAVNQTTSSGGLVGTNTATINNSFWNNQAAGLMVRAGDGTALTTAQMQAPANFSLSTTANGNSNPAWDFTSTWTSFAGGSPLLTSLLTYRTVTAVSTVKTYDGLMFAGASFTGKTPLNSTVTFAGNALYGVNAGSYVLTPVVNSSSANPQDITTAVSGTLVINKAPLTVAGTKVADKIYDATTDATLSGGSLSGLVASDASSVILNQSGVFSAKNAGSAIAVTSTDSLSGAAASNYTLIQPLGFSASISKASIIVSGIVAADKIYDGGQTSVISTGAAVLAGLKSGDFVSVATTGTFVDKNVGLGKTVNLTSAVSGVDAGNYVVHTQASTPASITPKSLTVSAITANSKVYDGNTTVVVDTGAEVLGGLVSGDLVSIAATGAFIDKNVGTSKAVLLTGFASGADASNYVFGGLASSFANITPKTLTISGVFAHSKTYDGGTTALIDTSAQVFGGLVAGDHVTVSATGSFADKNVGVAKTIVLSGIIKGTDASNYAINRLSSTVANITPKSLFVSGVTANSKVYDGSTTATLNTGAEVIGGLVAGDRVTLATIGTFVDKNVGTSKSVLLDGIVSGADASNYAFNSQVATFANITPKALRVSAAGATKVYDGSTAATVVLSSDAVIGDKISVATVPDFVSGIAPGSYVVVSSASGVSTVSITNSAANFADKNAGVGKAIKVTGIVVSGADAGNYVYDKTATAIGNITAKAINVQAAGKTKVYDAGLDDSVTLSSTGAILGDRISFANTSAVFADRNVGVGKLVSVSGISISGADSANYTLNNSTAATTASITPKTLTVSATGSSRVYDGTLNDAVTLSGAGIVGGDAVTFGHSAAVFANKNAGAGKAVEVTGIRLSGRDAGNYTSNVRATALGSITAKSITVTATGTDKVYDGSLVDAVTLNATGIFSGDVVNFTKTSALFANKNVALNKSVTVTGIRASGADSANYSFNTTASTSASITPKSIVVSASGASKVYDGLVNDVVKLTASGVVAGDVVVFNNASATFTDKNVGVNKSVTVNGITADGVDAGNYAVNTSALTMATITPKLISVTAVGQNKAYDGSRNDVVTLFSTGTVAGDNLVLGSTSAMFTTAAPGANKAVAVTGIKAVGGSDAANYTIRNSSAATSATILH